MYAHVAAFILADVLGANVQMPPSLYRNSYASRYEVMDQSSSDLLWTAAPVGALIDTDGLREDYARRGEMIGTFCH